MTVGTLIIAKKTFGGKTRSILGIISKAGRYVRIVSPSDILIPFQGSSSSISTPDVIIHVATQSDIDNKLQGRALPQWVIDIQNKTNPTGLAPLPLPVTPEGYIDTTPRKPMQPDPNAGRPTLQTFQQTCVHQFKTYIGFSKVFDYCIFCDVKCDT